MKLSITYQQPAAYAKNLAYATPQDARLFLHQLLSASFILSSMDELEGCNLYRHKLKQVGKQWKAEIAKLLNEMAKNGDADHEAFYSLMAHYEELFEIMGTLSPEYVVAAKEIVKALQQDPETVLARNDLAILPDNQTGE